MSYGCLQHPQSNLAFKEMPLGCKYVSSSVPSLLYWGSPRTRHPPGWWPWDCPLQAQLSLTQPPPPRSTLRNCSSSFFSEAGPAQGGEGAWINRIPATRALIAGCRLKEPHCAQLEGERGGAETEPIVKTLLRPPPGTFLEPSSQPHLLTYLRPDGQVFVWQTLLSHSSVC